MRVRASGGLLPLAPALGLALAILGWPRGARADLPELNLQWDAPPTCPSAEEVSAAVARLLSASGKGTEGRLTARVRVTSGDPPGTWRAEVHTDDGVRRGERVLQTESCDAAADAVAFVVFLAFVPKDPPSARAEEAPVEKTVAEPPPERPPRDRARVPPDADQTSRPPAEQPDAPPGRAVWIVGARGLAGIGVTPAPAAGLGLVAGVAVGPLRLEAAASLWLPRAITADDNPRTGAVFRRYAIDLRACYGPRGPSWTLAGCLGARGGRLEAVGFGATTNLRGGETSVGSLAGALLTWRFSETVGLRLEAEIAAQLTPRRQFLLLNEAPLYRSPPLSAGAAIGLELHF